MRIVIERTGGFAGIRRRYEREINEAQLDALKKVVADNLDNANYPDAFHYKVILLGEEEGRSLEVTEEALHKIIGFIS